MVAREQGLPRSLRLGNRTHGPACRPLAGRRHTLRRRWRTRPPSSVLSEDQLPRLLHIRRGAGHRPRALGRAAGTRATTVVAFAGGLTPGHEAAEHQKRSTAAPGIQLPYGKTDERVLPALPTAESPQTRRSHGEYPARRCARTHPRGRPARRRTPTTVGEIRHLDQFHVERHRSELQHPPTAALPRRQGGQDSHGVGLRHPAKRWEWPCPKSWTRAPGRPIPVCAR